MYDKKIAHAHSCA